MCGDFNFHWGEDDCAAFVQFKHLLDAYNLIQHVNQPTHENGNILDLVITRRDDLVLHSVCVCSLLTYHHAVLEMPKPHTQKIEMSIRKYKTIDSLAFDRTLVASDLILKPKDELVGQYNATLRDPLDTRTSSEKDSDDKTISSMV